MGAAPKLPPEELLMDFGWPRHRIPPATSIRGGYLLSSLRSIRSAGHGDAYYAALRQDLRGQMGALEADVWYPIDVGVAHFSACDAMGLPTSDILAIGLESANQALASWLGMLAKLSAVAGANPMTVLAQGPKHWGKAFVGSAVATWKTGPKEARIELLGVPFAGFRYVRVGMRGIVLGITAAFCKKVYVYDIPELCTHNSMGFRCAWV